MRNGMGVQVLGEQRIGTTSVVTVRVETRRGPVYLCIDDVAWHPDRRWLVMVDAGRLAQAWRQEIGNEGTGFDWDRPGTWTQDRKYARANAEMPNAQADPVALPKARCPSVQVALPTTGLRKLLGFAPPKEEKREIVLDDGVTRTLWMVHNGARALPMECPTREDAEALARLVGIPGAAPQTVADLRVELGAPLRRSA